MNEYHTVVEQKKSESNPDLPYAKSHSISIASGKTENGGLFPSLSARGSLKWKTLGI